MSSYLPAKDCRLRNTRQSHRPAGKRNPVVHDAEGNDLECKSCNGKIIITDAEGRDADNSSQKTRKNHSTNDVGEKWAVEPQS